MHGQEFLSCDWGTSSFRLRWISAAGAVRAEIKRPDGIRALHAQVAEEGPNVFARFLGSQLLDIAGLKPGLPLVISGMASSSIGWQEVPYAIAPFPLSGVNASFVKLSWESPVPIGPTFLLGGLRTEREMMRGEETETLGLMSFPQFSKYRARCLLLLPGTHSKHLLIHKKCITSISTHMTGELFQALASHTILSATTEPGPWSHSARKQFLKGVREAASYGMGASLFQARTRSVLGASTRQANYWFLSGVLIAGELLEMKRDKLPILIGGAPELARMYQIAADVILRGRQVETFSRPQLRMAAVRGHRLFLETHL